MCGEECRQYMERADGTGTLSNPGSRSSVPRLHTLSMIVNTWVTHIPKDSNFHNKCHEALKPHHGRLMHIKICQYFKTEYYQYVLNITVHLHE